MRRRHRIIYRYYVTHAKEFHERFGSDTLETEVRGHLDLLRGRTLVLGCGSGKEVEYLWSRGRRGELYGIDFSPEAIRLAQSAHPHLAGRFIVADFYDLEYIEDGEFDSIAANAAFVHLFERQDMFEMLRRVFRRLRPGGLCFIRNLYKESNKTPVAQDYHASKERFHDQRWFIYYPRTQLAELAGSAGFFVNHQATREIVGKGWDSDEVMEKGFPHVSYDEVFWPTLLLEKPR